MCIIREGMCSVCVVLFSVYVECMFILRGVYVLCIRVVYVYAEFCAVCMWNCMCVLCMCSASVCVRACACECSACVCSVCVRVCGTFV